MLLDGLGWSHYSVFAPCIMTQTRVLGRSGGRRSFLRQKNKKADLAFEFAVFRFNLSVDSKLTSLKTKTYAYENHLGY